MSTTSKYYSIYVYFIQYFASKFTFLGYFCTKISPLLNDPLSENFTSPGRFLWTISMFCRKCSVSESLILILPSICDSQFFLEQISDDKKVPATSQNDSQMKTPRGRAPRSRLMSAPIPKTRGEVRQHLLSPAAKIIQQMKMKMVHDKENGEKNLQQLAVWEMFSELAT